MICEVDSTLRIVLETGSFYYTISFHYIIYCNFYCEINKYLSEYLIYVKLFRSIPYAFS